MCVCECWRVCDQKFKVVSRDPRNGERRADTEQKMETVEVEWFVTLCFKHNAHILPLSIKSSNYKSDNGGAKRLAYP